MPLSSPYGTEVTIRGEWLDSARRADVKLLLGDNEDGTLTPASKPEITSWTESEIRFRFPFPFAGRVLVSTPEGEVVAGEFEPTWVAGSPMTSVSKVSALASIAHEPGVIAAIVATGPPSMVQTDGETWTKTAIAGSNLRADSLRLYTASGVLSAFGVTTATMPVIVELDPADDFSQKPQSVVITSDYRLAGGIDAAAIWYRAANNWTRVVPSAIGVWKEDKGPIADPNPSGPDHAAGATADGSLYVGWSKATGTVLDDRGVGNHRYLAPTLTTWGPVTQTGNEMDDEISSFTLADRGRGLVATYCGTDVDPVGLSKSDLLCFSALLPGGSKASVKESSTLHYGFGAASPALAYCSPTLGLRVVPELGAGGTDSAKLDKLAGDVAAWPCPNVVALEVDPEGQPLLMVELAGKLYSPRPRVQ
jgi:hypothetical protein